MRDMSPEHSRSKEDTSGSLLWLLLLLLFIKKWLYSRRDKDVSVILLAHCNCLFEARYCLNYF